MKTLRITLGCCLMVLAAAGACSESRGGDGGSGACDVSDPCSGCGGLSASNCCNDCSELVWEGEIEPDYGGGVCTEAGRDAWIALDVCTHSGSADSNPPGCGHVCTGDHPSAACTSCAETTCADARAACLAN